MTKRILLAAFLLILLSAHKTSAQKDSVAHDETYLGIGGGIDYGGIGLQLSYLPEKHFCMFAGGGYDFNDFGYNIGAAYKIAPDTKLGPYVAVMYGYNAVITIENGDQYDKTYYGVSFAFGVEPFHRRSKRFWSFELIVPVRSETFTNDLNALKSDPNITGLNDPLPVLFSIGYHFGL